MNKWHKRFLELSDHVAQWSKDPSTKVGSVIVDDFHRVVGVGYNGFPRGVKDTEARYNDRAMKLDLVAHAERNALDNIPFSVEGHTLYASLFPCNECAKSIVQRGIKRVITRAPTSRPGSKYDVTLTIFRERGVEIIYEENFYD